MKQSSFDGTMIDVTEAEVVSIQISGDKVWVNVDEVCRLRIQRAKTLRVDDWSADRPILSAEDQLRADEADLETP